MCFQRDFRLATTACFFPSRAVCEKPAKDGAVLLRCFGLFVTDRLSEGDQEMVFLSRSVKEHHQLVLAPGCSATSASTLNQISFEIEALPSLIEACQALKELNISRMQAMNHGGSWSLYVPDPEGNTVELFVKTHWYVPPHATTALDLSQSEELIRQQTQDLAQQTPGSKPWSVWRQEFQRQMDLADKQ